jgi:hypothetical protein
MLVSETGTSFSVVAVDANFFILTFAQSPAKITRFKEIIDRLSFKLVTSPQVLKELRWNLRREVQDVVEVVNISKEELQAYIAKAKESMERIPQAPDLSLLLVLKKLEKRQLVSSDFYLIQSLRSLEPQIEGLMGSAFLLTLLELSFESEEDAEFLEELRYRVLQTEIKYSLTRSSAYDPAARIQLIESQAFHILRSLRGPRIQEEDLVGMSAQEALGLRIFLQELRRRYPALVQMIQTQNYQSVLNELEVAREELYTHLVILAWELAGDAHRKLIRRITPDLVLVNYLMALSNLYLGEETNLLEAKRAIEECNRILLNSRPAARTYRRLMVMTHLLRITINLISEDFDAATMYFTIFSRKCKEWGFTREQATAHALYLALLVIRGDVTATKFPQITTSEEAEEIIRYLMDLASLYFMFRRFEEAWRLFNQVVHLTKHFKLFAFYEPILRRMTLIYYAEKLRRKDKFTALLQQIREWVQTDETSTSVVEQFQHGLAKEPVPKPEHYSETSMPVTDIHPDFRDWMTVIDRVDTLPTQESILICRSWKLDWNVGLIIQGVSPEEKAKGGEQVRLGEGKFRITKPPPDLKNQYHILALIHADPKGRSRLYIRGGQGFRLLKLGSLLDNPPS